MKYRIWTLKKILPTNPSNYVMKQRNKPLRWFLNIYLIASQYSGTTLNMLPANWTLVPKEQPTHLNLIAQP
jgi:hypothetical protein